MPMHPDQYFIPDGAAAGPGLPFEAEPGTGFYRKSAGKIGVSVGGAEVGEINANGLAGGLQLAEINFVEDGAGTYTGTIALPAGARIIDIGCDGIAVWNSAGAVSLTVGDGIDPDAYFTATDLKATDLLAGEANTIEHQGGKGGELIAAEQRVLYSASARDVVAVITVASGSGTLGRTRVYVAYAVGVAYEPVVS